MRFSFDEILSECPEIRQLRVDARSVAANERSPWYERWLPGSIVLREALSLAGYRLGSHPDDIRGEIVAGLLDEYRAAKRRLQPAALKPPKARGWSAPKRKPVTQEQVEGE